MGEPKAVEEPETTHDEAAAAVEGTPPAPPRQAQRPTLVRPPIRLNVLDPHYAFASDAQWRTSWDTWNELIKGGTLPRHVKTPEAAIALAEAGLVHGWSAMQSVRLLCLIEGQVAMTVNGMWMLVQQYVIKEAGARVRMIENTLERAAFEVVRPLLMGDEPVIYDFTKADAETAGLWGKKNPSGSPSPWVLYPRDMLVARAKARVCRNAFGDVVHGAYTDEELIYSSTFHVASKALVDDILDRGGGAKQKPTSLDELAAGPRTTAAAAGA
jgi:hypothetical protein